MNKKEIQEKLSNLPKPKYLYQRYNGKINKYELNGNILINVYNPNITIDRNRYLIYGKTSENIVDLIEEGDYVNGYKVLDIDIKNEMICLLMPFNKENKSKYNIVWNTKYFIKDIVTKEQFEKDKFEV